MTELLTQKEIDELLDMDLECNIPAKVIRKTFKVYEDLEYTIEDTINDILSDLKITPDDIISINEIKRNDVYEITFYYKGF
jgi:hypothetical protein